ncbi:MAG: NAD(P)H-hydrate dehydratase [Flavipsychrobacter sp.]|nr:NAD(P)H-hydrate dehydratase [Flavipsychrobacter sp.]
MKIFSAAQIRACDAYTIHASGITSLDLMERAAGKCAEWLMATFAIDTPFVILCGSGNNGGDGLTIARMMHLAGYGVKAFLLQVDDKLSKDCSDNLDRIKKIDSKIVTTLTPDTFITDIPAHIVIVDAILGTGINRPVTGWLAAFVNQVNILPNRKVAIDIPTGLPADSIPDPAASIMEVSDTLSFQFYKRTFLHPETGVFCGDIHILEIGLDETFISSTHSQYHAIYPQDIKDIYKPRKAFSHKGTYGNAFLIGGSYGKMGSITMSSLAALRAGAGLVTALVPECGYNVVQTAVPEAMCMTSGSKNIEAIQDWEKMKAIGIGPGMGTNVQTVKAFAAFVETCKHPLVIDADALNILSKNADLLAKVPANSVLTPHPKEFERLFGESKDSIMQLEQARAQAMRYNIFIVLKGHNTAIVTPEGDCWYNLTGNAGMATGGAGDVLTGIITGLMAQAYSAHEAALLGVYLHGLSGDIAAAEKSQEALIAGDIIDNLGKAFLQVAAY